MVEFRREKSGRKWSLQFIPVSEVSVGESSWLCVARAWLHLDSLFLLSLYFTFYPVYTTRNEMMQSQRSQQIIISQFPPAEMYLKNAPTTFPLWWRTPLSSCYCCQKCGDDLEIKSLFERMLHGIYGMHIFETKLCVKQFFTEWKS